MNCNDPALLSSAVSYNVNLLTTEFFFNFQDNEDLDSFDSDSDIFCKPKVELKQRGKRTEKKKLSANDEQRKKLAAIKCLLAISDEVRV